jgi:hypothetical protein
MSLRPIGGRSRTALALMFVGLVVLVALLAGFGVPTTDCPSQAKNVKGVCVDKDVLR